MKKRVKPRTAFRSARKSRQDAPGRRAGNGRGLYYPLNLKVEARLSMVESRAQYLFRKASHQEWAADWANGSPLLTRLRTDRTFARRWHASRGESADGVLRQAMKVRKLCANGLRNKYQFAVEWWELARLDVYMNLGADARSGRDSRLAGKKSHPGLTTTEQWRLVDAFLNFRDNHPNIRSPWEAARRVGKDWDKEVSADTVWRAVIKKDPFLWK